MTTARPRAMTRPDSPPSTLPTARNKPLNAPSNTTVFSPLMMCSLNSCRLSIMPRRPIMQVMASIRLVALFVYVGVTSSVFASQTQGTVQGPKPFPAPGSAQTPPAAANADSPIAAPLYPGAQFLEVIDAGKGQQFHLYGTDSSFAEIVAYYKTTLKNGGRVLFQ